MEPLLTIAISTLGDDGIKRVAAMAPPRLDGLQYVVSWQGHDDKPLPASLAARGDIKVVRTASRGLSANRNNAMDHCPSGWMLVGDDDLQYDADQLLTVMETLRAHDDLDYVLMRHTGHGSAGYPMEEFDPAGKHPRGYVLTSFDMALRCRDVRWDTNWGLGTPRLPLGEENILLLDLIAAGKRGRYIPVVSCRHVHPSTGWRRQSAAQHRAHGLVIRLQYPLSGLARLPLVAWRYGTMTGDSRTAALWNLLRGFLTPRPPKG